MLSRKNSQQSSTRGNNRSKNDKSKLDNSILNWKLKDKPSICQFVSTTIIEQVNKISQKTSCNPSSSFCTEKYINLIRITFYQTTFSYKHITIVPKDKRHYKTENVLKQNIHKLAFSSPASCVGICSCKTPQFKKACPNKQMQLVLQYKE